MCEFTNNNGYTKLTIEMNYGDGSRLNNKVIMESDLWDMDIWEFSEQMLRPALLAVGYQPGTIDELLGEPR